MVKLGEALLHLARARPAAEDLLGALAVHASRADREVVCHASAWDVTYDDDLRIKMCIEPTEEDLITIHHELGHDYYFHVLLQAPGPLPGRAPTTASTRASATRSRSRVTPGVPEEARACSTQVPNNDKGAHQPPDEDGARQGRLPAVRPAHRPVALGRVLRQDAAADDYNEAWWELRTEVPGRRARRWRAPRRTSIRARSTTCPANVPYTRYFLARIYQFQFHRALCKAAGHKGPLARVLHLREQGGRARSSRPCWQLGASKPWPEALAGDHRRDADGRHRACSSTSRPLRDVARRSRTRASSAAGDAALTRPRDGKSAPATRAAGAPPSRDAGARCRGPGRDRGRARPRASPLPSRHRCPGGPCPSSSRASPRPGVERSLVAPPTRSFTSPLISSILPLIWSLFMCSPPCRPQT